MKKKIAIIGVKYYPSKGGTSRVVENLVKKLSDQYNITIYCYKNPLTRENIEGVHVVQLPVMPLGVFK